MNRRTAADRLRRRSTLAAALLAGWAGSRLEATRTRRAWQQEIGLDAWRGFVHGIHRWRSLLDEVLLHRSGDSRHGRSVRHMRQIILDIGPDAPSLNVFAPPDVNSAAHELLSRADDITALVEDGRAVAPELIAQFDEAKWNFVVIASARFGKR